MRRPQFLHFTALSTSEHVAIRASLSYSSHAKHQDWQAALKASISPIKPIESVGLLSSKNFVLRILAFNDSNVLLIDRDYETDHFGDLFIKILHPTGQKIRRIQIYESLTHPGLELLIGSYFPVDLSDTNQILITDFDKTLVDTKYSTAKEVYLSLRSPLENFPSVQESVNLIHQKMTEGYHPFIVSASPHFYENAIRDWLYKNQIFTHEIFLKDYRRIFSFFEGDLSTKDIKRQGFYKLNHLINILLMTGIPKKLCLVGDGFESDTLIYLTLSAVLLERQDPWNIWNTLKKEESFQLTNRQHFKFLNQFYQLKNISDRSRKPELQIYIRCPHQEMIQKWQKRKFENYTLNRILPQVVFYQG
jgi:hypothetical protein